MFVQCIFIYLNEWRSPYMFFSYNRSNRIIKVNFKIKCGVRSYDYYCFNLFWFHLTNISYLFSYPNFFVLFSLYLSLFLPLSFLPLFLSLSMSLSFSLWHSVFLCLSLIHYSLSLCLSLSFTILSLSLYLSLSLSLSLYLSLSHTLSSNILSLSISQLSSSVKWVWSLIFPWRHQRNRQRWQRLTSRTVTHSLAGTYILAPCSLYSYLSVSLSLSFSLSFSLTPFLPLPLSFTHSLSLCLSFTLSLTLSVSLFALFMSLYFVSLLSHFFHVPTFSSIFSL